MPQSVRITSVPPGEAPLWVRERWVGLSLPLAQGRAAPLSFLTSGVLSGPKGWLALIASLLTGKFQVKRGFKVETNAALAVLAASHPDAAAWWRQNAPHLFQGKRYFVFHENAGEVLP